LDKLNTYINFALENNLSFVNNILLQIIMQQVNKSTSQQEYLFKSTTQIFFPVFSIVSPTATLAPLWVSIEGFLLSHYKILILSRMLFS
jgi:hypothetical protein